MSDKCITSVYIQKLGHEIQEIRERALVNIISKLDHGFKFDNDLARSKEILTRLFDWFLLEPCTKQDLVFGLITRILRSESGNTLIGHHGPGTIKKNVKQIHTYIEPKYYHHLAEIVKILDENIVIVPPLETDVPLSYRTGQSDFSVRPVGTTATTIEGFIRQDTSARQRNTPRVVTTLSDNPPLNYTIHPLRWQFLIEADRHVLQSIEESLKNPPQPASLLHSADFFSNVLLHDFPAEVFLQRPDIVINFHDLVCNCPSTRVTNSILNCLNDLTKALQVRINHYNDPCLYTTKEHGVSFVDSRSTTPDSSSRKTASGQSDDGRFENLDYLKTQQISFPHYCFSTFKCIFKFLCVKPENLKPTRRKYNQRGVNLALSLLDELLNLLLMVLSQDIWKDQSTPLILEIRKQMNDVLIGYGATLEYFRIEAASDEADLNNRVIQLCFLHGCANFLSKMIPLSQTGIIVPRNLKSSLANSLVDVVLSKLYPNLYNTLLNYVQSFKIGLDNDSMIKYSETNRICESMTSAVQFMKHGKSLSASEGIILAKEALPSLEFHKNASFVKQAVDLCATKLPLHAYDEDQLEKFEFVILKLLSHNLDQIREQSYRLCQKRVIAAIGPKFNASCTGAPGTQILFLCRWKILVEIASHGLTSQNSQIRNYSEDILIHIIKCKILVSEDIWNKIVEALIGSLPILLCHAEKDTSLGRCLLKMIDPDTADSLHLPVNDVVKGNIHILFGGDSSMREEAFSRLCWLLATQTDSREMLPRLNNLYDKALPNVCQIQRIVDINKMRTRQHFYQPSSLQQVLDLLKSPNVEPVIRRSALTQISVMMEDCLLHTTFLASDGLEVVLEVMKSSLIEKNYHDYPDSVIPAISVLKNVCLYQSSARLALCGNIEVFYNVLRSVFMFFTEEKARQDAVTLLFLLIFNDFIKGTPSKATFSVPYVIGEKLKVPFHCNTHWEISQYYEASLVDFLTTDKWCLSSLQIQWNSEIFGGLDELLTWKEIDYKDDIIDILKLKPYDLSSLKASSVDYYIKKHLIEIQNGTMHDAVMDSVNKLTTYVQLCATVPTQHAFLAHPWEATFSRFLKILPSSEEDAKLLSGVLKFLKLLVPFYRSSENSFWLPQLLKNPSNCLLDVITIEQSTNEDFKTLSQDLLGLITLCASQEQHFLDYCTSANPRVLQDNIESWRSVIEIIAKSLKFNDNTHFYNLSHLDNLLACLVHLTASLGWSDNRPGSPPKKIIFQLVDALCELVVVFHCGKGPTATVSVMGLSITRHVILILNHLIAEMQNSKMKSWERCFMDVEEHDWLKSFLILWSSRDVLLRAGALQLFAGLSHSAILAINIVNELKNENRGVWHLSITLLMDHDEASIVKENCAFLLANLLSHTVSHSNKALVTSLIPNTMRKGKDEVTTIFDLLDEYLFFKNVVAILTRLYTLDVSNFAIKNITNLIEAHTQYYDDSSSTRSIMTFSVVTPSFVKSLANLLFSLLNLNEDLLTYKLQDFGLVKVLFRCICNPSISISDTKKLALYCDIIEMDAGICRLLSHVAQANVTCLGTLLHTKDCLTVVVSLLNPNTYHTHLPQLIYLRNQLWTEIFKLLSVLTAVKMTEHSNEALRILTETIEDSGCEAFIETICEATKSLAFNDLQNSALLSLTSLLGVESQQVFTSRHSETLSMQNLLDTVRTCPKTLESNRSDFSDTVEIESEVAGAEICKILLNLYDLCNLKVAKDLVKKKSMITSSLTSILCISYEAKKYAFQAGLPTGIIKQLKDFYMKLSLESVDCLRRVLEKKRVCPLLKELDELIGLITNFMFGDETVKTKLAELGLSDFIHKLWVWLALQNQHLVTVLKMLCTFTTGCRLACQSLPLTSSVAGSGPRKIPTKISLLHAIINLIDKEMDLVSKTHSLDVLDLCFAILKNCCTVLECRIIICKSTLLSSVARLHPAITKKQKPWDSVELIWLEFLQTFTLYPEGQSSVAKIHDVFDLLLTLTSCTKVTNRTAALTVLRNVAFYQPNRSRLLTSDDFLNLLKTKLENGTREEKTVVVLMMWSLASNNQKGKIIFKAARLDTQLQQVLKQYQLSSELIPNDDVETVRYVLGVIRDSDRDS